MPIFARLLVLAFGVLIRKLRTFVYLDFAPLEGDRTSVTLRNFGYGEGEEWAKARAYFDRLWNAVMASLQKRFATKS